MRIYEILIRSSYPIMSVLVTRLLSLQGIPLLQKNSWGAAHGDDCICVSIRCGLPWRWVASFWAQLSWVEFPELGHQLCSRLLPMISDQKSDLQELLFGWSIGLGKFRHCFLLDRSGLLYIDRNSMLDPSPVVVHPWIDLSLSCNN